MWTCTHTERTTARPEQLWRRYTDPAGWPDWDHATERVTLEGPFAVGTFGTLKPRGGPATRFRLVEVTEGRSFTDETRLPLARMRFAHTIDPTEAGATITHTVTIAGPLSPLFARVIGRDVAAGLPDAMRRLGSLATTPVA